MFYLIFALVVGINFSTLVLNKPDIWHGAGMYAQALVLLMFSWTFFEIRKFSIPKNIPLGLLHLWTGGFTLYFCYLSQVSGKYNIAQFFPYFNFLCILLFIRFVGYLSKSEIIKILIAMKYTVTAVMIVAVLQAFRLSQFFALIDPVKTFGQSFNFNLVTGFLGNGTHLSGYLASCAPLYFLKFSKEDKLSLVLMAVLLTRCGMMVNDPSVSGFVVLAVVTVYMLKRNKFISGLAVLGAVTGGVALIRHPSFFSFSGRQGLWEHYWELSKSFFITGRGLGIVNQIAPASKFPAFRHLHLEYFHFLFELGFIGLVLIINVIRAHIVSTAETQEQLVTKGLVIGFLVSCLFNYPAHLWIPATWAAFSYGAFIALKERESADRYAKTTAG